MRKVVWFSLGFGTACAIGTYFAPGLWALLLAAGFLLGYGGLSLLRHRHWGFAAAGLLCLGVTVGCCWFCVYDGVFLQPARLADGTTREITLEVTDYPVATDYGIYLDGNMDLSGRTYKCRLYLTEPETIPEPSDVVTVSAELRLTTSGGHDEPTYHRSGGIFLLAYGRDTAVITDGEDSFLSMTARFRKSVGELLREIFPEDTVGFCLSLLLGDKSDLSYTQRNTMSITGISHVAAVSGMHLSIAFALVYLVTMKRRVLSAVLGIPAAFFFAAVAGFSPSVSRAALMLTLSLVAGLLKRDYDPPIALAFSALVLLVINPTVIAGASFQLSVAAVAGIFCFASPMGKWMGSKLPKKGRWAKVLRALVSAVAATLGATVFTAPIGAAIFGSVSLVSPLTNLLTLWAVSLTFYGVMLAAVCAWIYLPLGKALAWVVGWLARYILGVTELLGRFPLAAVYPESNPYIAAWVIFAVVLLCVFLLTRCRNKVIFVSGMVAGLLLAVVLPCLEPLTEDYRVTVLDVGQGQCIVLQSQGRVFLVDCGGSEDEGSGETAARYLLTQGVSRIDGLILTHYDHDHTSGTAHFLSRIEVDALYLPLMEDEPDCARFGAMAKKLFYVTEDMSATWDGVDLRIFAPVDAGEANDRSLSVLFSAGDYDALITGDMDTDAEETLVTTHSLPDIELLVAGHHGSKYSTGDALLTAVQPEVIAVSVGKNSYGHPALEMLDRAENYGCTVYRTDLSGTLIFKG